MLKFKLKSLIWSNKLKSSTVFFVFWYDFHFECIQFILCWIMELVEFLFIKLVAIFMILFSSVWFRLVLFISVQLISFPFLFWIFLDNHFNLNFNCEPKIRISTKTVCNFNKLTVFINKTHFPLIVFFLLVYNPLLLLIPWIALE